MTNGRPQWRAQVVERSERVAQTDALREDIARILPRLRRYGVLWAYYPADSVQVRAYEDMGRVIREEDVVVGSTNASAFAYVADGRNGLKVLQLTSPDSQPNFYGFSPAPMPAITSTAGESTPRLPSASVSASLPTTGQPSSVHLASLAKTSSSKPAC